MGYFVDNQDLQPKDIVNSYVSSYLNGTEKYSKFQSSSPSFVTYYSKDQSNSTSDFGLDNVEEIIGSNSPLKYNKLKDFPIYGVAEMTPQTEWDEETGIDNDEESEAYILPNTIQPLPDDFIVFQYQTKDKLRSRIFRIDDVETNNFESQSYYKIHYTNFNVDTEDIEKQVTNTYRTIFSNIGTENKSLILEEDYYNVSGNIKSSDDLSKIFIDEFYNSSLNTFIYYEDEFSAIASVKYIDLSLSRFIYENNLLVKSNNYLSNIMPYVDKNPKNERANQRIYRNSIYQKLKNKEELPNLLVLNDTKDSFLKIFREKYKEISFLPKSLNEEGAVEGLDDFIELTNVSKTNRVNKDYQNINSLTDLDVRYKMIILYLQDEKIETSMISKVIDYYNSKYDYELEDYILMPCLMYIMKNNIEKVFKK